MINKTFTPPRLLKHKGPAAEGTISATRIKVLRCIPRFSGKELKRLWLKSGIGQGYVIGTVEVI